MSRPHPTRAVIFDLDGTLLNSLPLVLRAFAHALEPFGYRPTMEMFARFGGPPEKIFPTLLADAGHVPAAMDRLHDFNRDHLQLVVPFPGVPALLTELRARGVRLAVWTGRDRVTTDDLLAKNRLAEFFDAVVCGDDLDSHKPDSAGLREILRRLGLSPAEAIYIGDADVDVEGGAGAEVDTVLIRHGRQPDAVVEAKAWRSVGSPTEAYEWALSCTSG